MCWPQCQNISTSKIRNKTNFHLTQSPCLLWSTSCKHRRTWLKWVVWLIHFGPMSCLVRCGSALLQVLWWIGCDWLWLRLLDGRYRFTPSILLNIISPSLSQVLEACLCYQQFIYSYWVTADHSFITPWGFLFILRLHPRSFNWNENHVLQGQDVIQILCTIDTVYPMHVIQFI